MYRKAFSLGVLRAAALALAALVATPCLVQPAYADDAADVVMLKSGGRVRGTIFQDDPTLGVKVRLLDGRVREIKPAEIAEVQYAHPTPPPAPAAPSTPASGPVAPAPAPAVPAPASAVPAPPPASPPDAGPVKSRGAEEGPASRKLFTVGLRLGAALPAGHFDGSEQSVSLSDQFALQIPIGVDLGFMVTSNIMVGLYGQFGFIIDKTGPNGCTSGQETCTDWNVEIGIQGQYHVLPGASVDPWVGIGFGYEIQGFTRESSGAFQGLTISGSGRGPQFLKLQGGTDFKIGGGFTLGPFVSFSLAEYTNASSSCSSTNPDAICGATPPSSSIADKALHEWFTIGVKGAYGF